MINAPLLNRYLENWLQILDITIEENQQYNYCRLEVKTPLGIFDEKDMEFDILLIRCLEFFINKNEKQPRYIILNDVEGIDAEAIVFHNRSPYFIGTIHKNENIYSAKLLTNYLIISPTQLGQMAQWYFFTKVKK
jgi:hypothetical protein